MSALQAKLASSVSLGFCAALLFSGACSSSTTHPPTATGGSGGGSGGGGGGEGGSATDGSATSDLDSGHCLSGTFQVDTDTGLGGTNEIAGTVQFAQMVNAGHTIVLTITNTMNATITYADTFSFMTVKNDFTFRLRSLPDGTYVIQAQADIASTASAIDPGDLDGYYGGTVVTPVHTRADSTPITVPACRGATEFGIGPK